MSALQVPNLSPLVSDYLYRYEKVAGFYNGDFRDLQIIRNRTESYQSIDYHRKELTSILKEQNRGYGCGETTLANIDKLRQDTTCAVVTGQQVGLFSGPLYTIYKTLTAIKLADILNKRGDGYFVPVFWLASEDHDIAEIDHIDLLDKNNEAQRIRFELDDHDFQTPASKILLTQDVSRCLDQLNELTHDSEFKGEVLSHLSEAYRPGRSFVEAFAMWMTRLFESFGVIFIDASHSGLKAFGKDIFAREIDDVSPSTRIARETAESLRRDDYPIQVPLREGILNLFLSEGRRLSIKFEGEVFFLEGSSSPLKKSELLSILDKEPFAFSPNVLLRSVYQDKILPTAAYIGGPGEIAYFAQLKGVYEKYGVDMPVIYPRTSISLVENKVNIVLTNFNLDVSDIWQNIDTTIKDILIDLIPESLEESLLRARTNLERDFETISEELDSVDPTLQKAAETSLGKIKQQVEFLETKILRAQKRQNEIVVQRLMKAKNNLHPGGRPQERVFNIVPFLFKYGYTIIEKLFREIDILDPDHQVLSLEDLD
ncbi:bacillithiol biosynthesis cysteine-adding enzyme BshC [Acidobacteriota bacterium]